jgi:hypothetical protein
MAANSLKDFADYPLDQIQYYDKAAPIYEGNSMTLKKTLLAICSP